MLSTVSTGFFHRRSLVATSIVIGWLTLMTSLVQAQPGNNTQRNRGRLRANATVESLFKDFLHFARVGRFTAANAHAQALINHPDLDPVALMKLADNDREAIDTLLILIKNSTIGDSATKVLNIIHQGEFLNRQSVDRIRNNILLLGGDPQQEYFAIKALVESGEYAIPHLVDTLLDPQQKNLKSRIINALPKIGKPAVRPLVIALAMRNNDIRRQLISALGYVGYPEAIPYLRKIMASSAEPQEARDEASAAIERIESITGRTYPGSPEESFTILADQYYNEDDTVRADPRLDQANVWYWDTANQVLDRETVSTSIFGTVMAMRCADEALLHKNDHVEAIALWLASNIRRESLLGLDVESGDPIEQTELDSTRPQVFPRALYFTLAAGPRYAHLVLDRAVKDNDSAVALGAIKSLKITAGPTSLIGAEDYKQPLVKALHFSDSVVRLRAALALGAALPKMPFEGSDFVIPVLAAGLNQSGKDQILVVDADEVNLNRVVGELRSGGHQVIGDSDFFRGMDRASKELQSLTGMFISTDIVSPGLGEVMRRFRSSYIFSKTPIVVMIKEKQDLMAREAAEADRYAEPVEGHADGTSLKAAFQRVRDRSGQTLFDPDLALSMALESAETLRRIVVDGGSIFDVNLAEPALIGTLSAEDEGLQMLSASVLALLSTPTAQRAVAHIALDDTLTDSLRIASFASLAESAKNNGNQLEDDQVNALVEIAHHDDDLVMRTAASQALGAINLVSDKASEIIRSYYGG